MKQAIVAVEDKRFFEHHGIDLHGILRALWADVTDKKVVQGGSTITQQFIKNAFTGQQRSFGRKLKEAALAWQLEQQWPKDRILTAYLNTIYFGNGAYGIEQAAEVYFGEHASALSLSQAALLAGITADPTLYDPVTHPRLARERRARVLTDMLAAGRHHERPVPARARGRPSPRPGRPPPRQRRGRLRTSRTTSSSSSSTSTARAAVFGGGLQVRTSIDLNLQDIARRGDREVAAVGERAVGGARRDRPARRARAGHVRRAELQARASSTSPSRASGSPARRSSRSRSRRRCNRGSRRRRRFDSKPVTISLDIGQGLVRPQLRGREPGYDRPRVGDDPLRQHGLRAAREDRRPAEDRRYGRARSGSRAISTRSSRSCSAARPSTRSRWPARTRPSRTGASASTARSSGTIRARSCR